MKKLLFMLILAFIFGSGLHAQQPLNFAPVGAEWYYNKIADYPPIFLHSFTKFQCIGTTTIDGKECHIIEKYFRYDCGGHIVDSSSIYYLYIDSLQVYEVENQNIYLLYDFSKNVGEYWIMSKYNDTIFVKNIEDFVLTNGDTCKIFTVENVLHNYYYSEITNRFGGIEGLYPILYMTDCEWGGIRCYMEDSIIVYKNWNNNCDYSSTSGFSELIISDIKIPNPVSDNITILTSNNKISIKSIEIYTMTGQFVLSLPHPSGDKITIPFSDYHNGMYIMKLLLQDQSCKTYKIIKL